MVIFHSYVELPEGNTQYAIEAFPFNKTNPMISVDYVKHMSTVQSTVFP